MTVMRTLSLSICLIVFFQFLTACSTSEKKIPDEKINTFNQKLAEVSNNAKTRHLKDSSLKPLPFKKGQWVTFVTTYKDEKNLDRVLTTFKVINQSKKLLTLEVETTTLSTGETNILQYEVENYPRPASFRTTQTELKKLGDKMIIKKLRMKYHDGSISQVPDNMLVFATGMAKKSIVSFAPESKNFKIEKVNCQTSYLSSNACLHFKFEGELAGRESNGEVMAHSEIPIISFVRSDSKSTTIEVVSFGTTGANSSF